MGNKLGVVMGEIMGKGMNGGVISSKRQFFLHG